MKRRLRGNWSFIRLLQLGTGLAIIVHSALVKDWMLAIAGLFLSGMAIFSIGCCGANACNPVAAETDHPVKDISYEEVV